MHCCFSVSESCLTLCNPMDCSTSGSPVLHYLLEFAQIHVYWVSDANHLILCWPFLLLPSIFPSIRVFCNKSAVLIRWPKYWSFRFSISPSNELEKEVATHSSTLAWRIPWREEPGGLQSMGLQRVGHDWATSLSFFSFFLLMNIQGKEFPEYWFPLGLTGLISLLSKGLWRVFCSTTIQKHQYFGAQPSLWSNSLIHTWLLEKP